MTERRTEYFVSDKLYRLSPNVAEEIERLLRQRLLPELIELLHGDQPFRIEIHGKPGGQCKVHVTRFDPN